MPRFALCSLALLIMAVPWQANGEVITAVEILDNVNGPAGSDTDNGVTSAFSSFSGISGGSTFAGTASAAHTTFFVDSLEYDSFQFQLLSTVTNGGDGFETRSRAVWTETITGTVGDLVLLPTDLTLIFRVTGRMSIQDNVGAATVFSDADVNANNGVDTPFFALIHGTNTNGGETEFDITNLNSFNQTGSESFEAILKIPVKRDIEYTIDFRSLSEAANLGTATGNLASTISLIGITNNLGTESFNNVTFDSGVAFSAAPEPSSLGLAIIGLGGFGMARARRKERSSL